VRAKLKSAALAAPETHRTLFQLHFKSEENKFTKINCLEKKCGSVSSRHPFIISLFTFLFKILKSVFVVMDVEFGGNKCKVLKV